MAHPSLSKVYVCVCVGGGGGGEGVYPLPSPSPHPYLHPWTTQFNGILIHLFQPEIRTWTIGPWRLTTSPVVTLLYHKSLTFDLYKILTFKPISSAQIGYPFSMNSILSPHTGKSAVYLLGKQNNIFSTVSYPSSVWQRMQMYQFWAFLEWERKQRKFQGIIFLVSHRNLLCIFIWLLYRISFV